MSLQKKSSLSLVVIFFIMIFIQGHASAQAPSTSLSFNGVNSYFTFPSHLDFGPNDFTIEIKAKIDSIPHIRSQLLSKRIADNQYIELQVAPDGTVEYEYGRAGYGIHLTSPSNTAKLGVYHHYSMVRQGSSIKLYVDGVERASASLTSTVDITNNSDWYIGSDVSGFTEYLNGNISEVRFWNRARTSDEIQQSLNTNFNGNESGLIGLWKLDPITTDTLYDHSDNKNHATGSSFAPPTSLSASDITDLGLSVSWDNLNEAASYELKRDDNLIMDSPNNQFKETSLLSDTAYSYSLVAKNQNGKSVPAAATFSTKPGSLEIISVPANISLTPVKLNGEVQKSYGTFTDKLVIKDTRKVRDGWRLVAQATNLSGNNRTFPGKKIELQPASSVVQTSGLLKNKPVVINQKQTIDSGLSKTLIQADPKNTGYGIYEISLPPNAIELTLNPENAYKNNYVSSITWSLVPGNQ